MLNEQVKAVLEIEKEHPDIPPFYEVEIQYIIQRPSEKFQVVSHSYIMPTKLFEVLTVDETYIIRNLDTIAGINFDKNFTITSEIRQKIKDKNKK